MMCSKKEECRKNCLARRARLSPFQRKTKSEKICQKILNLPYWQRAKRVMLYVTYRNEVDTILLIQEALKTGKILLLPKVEKKEIVPYGINSFPEDVAPGYKSILEPIAYRCQRWAGAMDIIIVPGCAFDFQGNRLGYGLGCYDRFLKKINPSVLKIGLTYEICLVSHLPVEKYDEKVNVIVTEKQIIKIKNKQG